MDALAESHLDRFVRRVCLAIPEYRQSKNLRYPAGSLVLALLLCECAGRFTQRSKAIWLKSHWHWIKKLWHKAGGAKVEEKGTPSQSTLCRFLETLSEESFARLVYGDEREKLSAEWDSYLKKCKAGVVSRRKKKTPSTEAKEGEATPSVLL